jgi:hypothetical protein
VPVLKKKNTFAPTNFNKRLKLMKKLSVFLAVMVASVAIANAQNWAIGARAGSGLQAVGQKYFQNENYFEARAGLNLFYGDGMAVDASLAHMWNITKMNWTPKGQWYFDLGGGASTILANHFFFIGVQGVAKLSYEFENIPLRLSADLSPSFGPGIFKYDDYSDTSFYGDGIGNFGVSCVYRF